jgi:hypothetical protein
MIIQHTFERRTCDRRWEYGKVMVMMVMEDGKMGIFPRLFLNNFMSNSD